MAIKQAVSVARRVPLTVAFVGLFGAAEIAYAALTRPDALRLAEWASTNVARLRTEPVGPMVVSVFVVQEDPLAWLIAGGAALAIVEWRLGWWRALVAALAAHVLGTLVSEGIVWWRVHHRALSASALQQFDVGVSYVVVGLLAAAVVVAPWLGQTVAAGVLVALSPALLSGLTAFAVPAVGHLTSAVVGAASGLVLRVGARRSEPRLAGQPA